MKWLSPFAPRFGASRRLAGAMLANDCLFVAAAVTARSPRAQVLITYGGCSNGGCSIEFLGYHKLANIRMESILADIADGAIFLSINQPFA
jgi:hypothetical protein